MSNSLNELLDRRCKRSIAIVLGVKERECDQHLPPAAQAKLRKVVLDQFNDLTAIAMDVLGSLEGGGVVLNEFWLEKIEQIHAAVVAE